MSDQSPVRIGCASAFWGDSQTAAGQLVSHGRLDYLVFDYLAEITLSIMAGQRMRDESAGYARDFVEVAMAPNLAEIKRQGIRVVSNAGGINPLACRDALLAAAEKAGVELSVAVVNGDNLTNRQGELRELPVSALEGSEALPPFMVSVNAYLGAFPVAAALAEGADIVLTGRVTDSALVLGPLIHEFGWGREDHDLLAAGSLAGHLIECGTQCTGGNFTDWQQVPGYENMGFPIVEVSADGGFIVTKPEGTGGLVSPATVAEQLVYEIGDPQSYRLPDVICDFSQVALRQVGDHQVAVSGALGRAPGPDYKVAATYPDGFRCVALFMVGGIQAPAKGQRVAQAIVDKSESLLSQAGFAGFTETSIEVLGSEATYGPHARRDDSREVVVKIGVRHPEKRALVLFSREIAQAATAMAPGLTGYVGGRPIVHPLIRLVSFMLPKQHVPASVLIGEREFVLEPEPEGEVVPAPEPHEVLSPREAGEVEVPLIRLAHARSGDKGNHVNIGVIARQPDYLPWIAAALTSDAVGGYLAHLGPTTVHRWYLPGIHALNFLLENALAGGGVASLRMDPQGKAAAQMLLDMPVAIPAALAEWLNSEPETSS